MNTNELHTLELELLHCQCFELVDKLIEQEEKAHYYGNVREHYEVIFITSEYTGGA